MLGLVRASNTPQQNVALIDAAVQFMVGQGGGRSSQSPQPQQNSQAIQMLGNIADQVASASGVPDASKNQILGGIAQILGQLIGQAQPQNRANGHESACNANGGASGNGGAGQSSGSQMNQQLIQALGNLADQISQAPGMSDSVKNQILAEISQILAQLGRADGGAPSQVAGAGQGTGGGAQGAGGQAQPGGQAADQLLGLINAQNSPQANKALIDAAIEQMQQAGGGGGAQQNQPLVQMLGKIADQVAGAQGMPDATKNQILGQIAQALSQLQQKGDQTFGSSGSIGEAVSALSQDVHNLLSGNPSLASTIEGELSQVLAAVGGAE
ncbi:MAG: hypothetical protein WA418_25595 [Bradyrhizobium sp.]